MVLLSFPSGVSASGLRDYTCLTYFFFARLTFGAYFLYSSQNYSFCGIGVIKLLKACSEEEKLCAFVYLFQLAESDSSISRQEVRLLIHALKATNVDFKDVALSNDLATSNYRGAKHYVQAGGFD